MIILGFITNSGRNSPLEKLPRDWALLLPGAVGWAGINPGLFVLGAHRPAALTAGFSSAPSFIKSE